MGLADLANLRGLVRHPGIPLERDDPVRYVVAARDPGAFRRNLVYLRDEFVQAWVNGSGGISYLVYQTVGAHRIAPTAVS